MSAQTEAQRRRTFAIISHPDAGKTTLTEKLLLYSGSIHMAGSIRSRKAARHAVSDWMQMEQERGISITSSVLQYEYRGAAMNLLDTPGHADFSEDTYRTLSAVDSAIMLMDHVKGVEARTLKLFEVCRLRKLPVVTFMNKMDRDGRDPLELIDEIASTLDLKVAPINWPIGMGREFKGVVEIASGDAILFEAEKHGQVKLQSQRMSLDEAEKIIGSHDIDLVREQLELLEGAGDQWNTEAFLRGELSPIFWGSAMTNFGVEPLLEFMAEFAAPPALREARLGDEDIIVEPGEEKFSGFIFKIQANMNPRHRDRVAFMRVVSGRFNRGMEVLVGRSAEKLRLAKPHSFMAQERSIVEEAWPGDIVGLYDPGKLRIGDTVAEGRVIKFGGIPRFAPEHFCRVLLNDPLKRKQLNKGLEQLSHEGVIQAFYRPAEGRQDPWLGAVGVLQFEVLKQRLLNEYSVDARLETLPYTVARWIGGEEEGLKWLKSRRNFNILEDRNGHAVLLADSTWAVEFAQREQPGLIFYDVEPL
jgi:peptide chain release factor 3